METTIAIIAVVAGIIGIVGSILPGLPGVPISWLGMLALYIWGNGTNSAGDPLSLTILIVWAVIVFAVTVLDYIVPPIITKKMGGSKYAERGALVGLVAGIILTPVGMILGSFLGAFLFEMYYARKDAGQALKVAFGSFLGFITGTGLKTIASVLIFIKIIDFSFF